MEEDKKQPDKEKLRLVFGNHPDAEALIDMFCRDAACKSKKKIRQVKADN